MGNCLGREGLEKVGEVTASDGVEERLESVFEGVVSDQASLSLADVVGRQSGGISGAGGELENEAFVFSAHGQEFLPPAPKLAYLVAQLK